MLRQGCTPNSASVDLVVAAGGCANADDAVDVYSALRGFGIPEFLCYTAAMKCVFGPGATWGAKSDVGIAHIDSSVEPLKTKRKPAPQRCVASSTSF
jgi:hypothetical protein